MQMVTHHQSGALFSTIPAMRSNGCSEQAGALASALRTGLLRYPFQPLNVSPGCLRFCLRRTMSLIAVFIHINVPDLCRIRHFRIWVAEPREIGRSSLNVQVLEKMIILRQRTELRDLAFRVLDIT